MPRGTPHVAVRSRENFFWHGCEQSWLMEITINTVFAIFDLDNTAFLPEIWIFIHLSSCYLFKTWFFLLWYEWVWFFRYTGIWKMLCSGRSMSLNSRYWNTVISTGKWHFLWKAMVILAERNRSWIKEDFR